MSDDKFTIQMLLNNYHNKNKHSKYFHFHFCFYFACANGTKWTIRIGPSNFFKKRGKTEFETTFQEYKYTVIFVNHFTNFVIHWFRAWPGRTKNLRAGPEISARLTSPICILIHSDMVVKSTMYSNAVKKDSVQGVKAGPSTGHNAKVFFEFTRIYCVCLFNIFINIRFY